MPGDEGLGLHTQQLLRPMIEIREDSVGVEE
jgi:hypothetical protein